MTNIRSAALRVQSFLDEHQAGSGGYRADRLLTVGLKGVPLNASDLRALVAAVLAVPEQNAAPFTWYVKNGRMWHAGCGKEVLRVGGRLSDELLCECGEGSR